MMQEIVLLSDPRIAAIPVAECGDPLVDLRTAGVFRLDSRLADDDGDYAHLRAGVVDRLVVAQSLLPRSLRFLVVEGYRPLSVQVHYFQRYREVLRAENPEWTEEYLHVQASRSLSPPEVAPHVAGAAVDLTLCTPKGAELPMGCPLNASPEASEGTCYTTAPGLSHEARVNRRILCDALSTAGLVNYPTEWWHWSFGDRYWAFSTSAPAARYGPVAR